MIKIRNALLTIFVIAAIVPRLVGDDLERKLKVDYENRIFLIRGFYQDDSLQFGTDGMLNKPGHVGSWTTSFVYVNRLRMKSNAIEIEAARVVQVTDTKTHQLAPLGTKQRVLVRIDESSVDEDAIVQSLHKVFVGSQEPLAVLVPDDWRSVVENLSQQGLLLPHSPNPPDSKCPPEPTLETPCRVGGEVKRPEAIRTKDPAYEELARAYKFQGTTVLWLVIDETGVPRNIKIARQPVSDSMTEPSRQSKNGSSILRLATANPYRCRSMWR